MGQAKILRDGKNRIVVDKPVETFNSRDVKDYKMRFLQLKESGNIEDFVEFSDVTWTLLRKHKRILNVPFIDHKHPKLNIVLKCLAIRQMERGMMSHTIQNLHYHLNKVIDLTDCFSNRLINEFEDYLFEDLTESQLNTTLVVVREFLTFYDLYYAEDYLSICDLFDSEGSGNARKIPDYRSILVFNHAINQAIWNNAKAKPKNKKLKVKRLKNKKFKNNKNINTRLKYYPLYLWWRITSIIPLRPSEFLELDYNCCYKDSNGRYWIKLPRNKIKKEFANQKIEIVDALETTEDIYNIIEEYKSLLRPEFKSKYLISWKAYNYCSEFSGIGLSKVKNPEIMFIETIHYLMQGFYKTMINERDIIPLKPGDSRHLAFCNLMLQGVNPITIARMGGHKRLESQFHYSQHLDTYAESYVFTMADKLKLMSHLKTRNASGKYESLKRSKLLVTYSREELGNLLEIQKGYCQVIKKDDENADFSKCQKDCWFCHNHMLDTKRYPEAIKELSGKSDRLGVIIKEQIALLTSISKNMFIDYSTEECSFEGKSRLASTAAQMQSIMKDKIIIDSKLLDYIKEG